MFVFPGRNHWPTGPLARLASVLGRIAGHVRYKHCLFAAVFVLAGESFWLSFEVRFDFNVPPYWADQRLLFLPYVAAIKLLFFVLVRGHATNWRYFGLDDLPRLAVHCLAGSGLLLFAPFAGSFLVVPRGVIVIDFFLSLVFIGGTQVSSRFLRERLIGFLRDKGEMGRKPAVIIGAGDAGEIVLREILRSPKARLRVTALFDDDPSLMGQSMRGLRVIGPVETVPAYVRDHGIEVALIAIPSANQAQMKRIYEIMKDLNITVKTLPSIHELMNVSSTLTQMRDLDITDLLGREEIHIDSEQVENLIRDKVVLVTGAGGSIGSELCRQILKRKPGRLLLMERSESNLFHVHRNLIGLAGPDAADRVIPLLCDVREQRRVEAEFEHCRPDLVFHAAAYKHVPMQEAHAAECFRNNVGGMQTLARVSDRYGVSSFLLISTDKAVNPRSVMGATKRVCELYCSAYGRISRTEFLSVRFGNVLASDGSVVPIFMDQISRGGPVTVTHPDMRRYFMTIPEATTLVLQAAALGESGHILVLDMGEPIRILDMVRHLVQLMGKGPDEIPIEFVGLRPGEKLFEELSGGEESLRETAHRKIRIFDDTRQYTAETIEQIDQAFETVEEMIDPAEVRAVLKGLVPEYQPEYESVNSVGVGPMVPVTQRDGTSWSPLPLRASQSR